MKQPTTIGLIQSTGLASSEENLKEAIRSILEAADQGAQIICLQELYRSRYFCQQEDAGRFSLAESIPGPSTDEFCRLAAELGVVIVAPLFEKRAEGLYHNTAVVIDVDGKLAGRYRKMHIPDDPCFYEKFYFTPGDTGFRSFPTRFGRVGVLICWDQWFPEAARLTALSGAEFIFYPTAIGHHDDDRVHAEKQYAAWQTVQRGHAIANGVFVAAVNRVGREESMNFWGRSFVSDPFGEVIAQAGDHNPEILIAHCDREQIGETRRHWPFLRDRRIDAYPPITSLFIEPNDLTE
jgi:N-carbamoylputrescine amidase